jgi:heme/copper-type cytochrome/quinol oxidase subunit 3
MNAQAHAAHPPTATGLDTWKLGFWIFIGSETLFFGSLITTYMVYADAAVVGPYPHEILDIPLTTISTFVLLMSSLLMVLALHAIQQGNRRGTLTWLMATVIFGAIFLGFQAYEFTHFVHEGLTLQQNIFGASFYVLTGFLGLHERGADLVARALGARAARRARTEGRAQGRDRRAVLAFRRRRVDRDLHADLPHVRRTLEKV